MTKKVEKVFKTAMAAGASFGALVVDSMAEPGRGTVDVKLKNGAVATLMEFDYLDKATSKRDVYKNGVEIKPKQWAQGWESRQITEYQLPNNVVLAVLKSESAYDRDFEQIYHTAESIRLIPGVMRFKEGQNRPQTNPEGVRGVFAIHNDEKWPYERISLYDDSSNSFCPVIKAKFDFQRQRSLNVSHFLSEESYIKNTPDGGFYARGAPSKSTMSLEDTVFLLDEYLGKLIPLRDGKVIDIDGFTMNKDIFWNLTDVDVSHVKFREKNEVAKVGQPKREDAMLVASQGKAPAYTASATVPDQVTVGLQSHADKRKAQEDATRQKRLEELMREIQAEGGSVSQTSPKKKISEQSVAPAEGVLASARTKIK
ncbi:MAG: hypothetical protein LBU87_06790 [Lactobacillales bacterium]|jgi:hypothetical protein|nr:hypothetical protein [Lactobacillales bacterium]